MAGKPRPQAGAIAVGVKDIHLLVPYQPDEFDEIPRISSAVFKVKGINSCRSQPVIGSFNHTLPTAEQDAEAALVKRGNPQLKESAHAMKRRLLITKMLA